VRRREEIKGKGKERNSTVRLLLAIEKTTVLKSSHLVFFQTTADINSTAGLQRTSSVSAFTDVAAQQQKVQGIQHSAISTYTTAITGAAKGDTSIESFSASVSGLPAAFDQISNTLSTNIADRAKMRQRTQKKQIIFDPEDIIELTSDDDDDELSLKPSTSKSKSKAKEKGKEKPRPKPKPKAKKSTDQETLNEKPDGKMLEDPNVAIGDSAASTSTSMAPNPRPRPRPKKKPPRTTDTVEQDIAALYKGIDAILPPLTPPHGPELPIATSPSTFPPIIDLPPSDPPTLTLSTTYTAYTGAAMRIPPIETLQDPLTSDRQVPSSPDSLFSEHDSFTSHLRKRKRPVSRHPEPEEEEEMDQLVPSSHSKKMLPPPPTFFAGSSSSFSGGNDNDNDSRGGNPDFVDLTKLPPTMDPTASSEKLTLKIKKLTTTNTATATKKKKAKIVHDDAFDDAFDAAPMVILDEDDADDDFDPSGYGGAKKGKGKAKAVKEKKPKEKKERKKKENGKEKADGTIASAVPANADGPVIATSIATPASGGRPQVEVVITAKPPSSKKKEKTKEKGKAKDQDKDKEVFKSREFIEDSDDELAIDMPGAPPHAGVPETPTLQKSKSKSVAKPAETRHSIDTDPVAMPVSTQNSTFDVSSSKRRASGVKRKTIVDSDEEDDEFAAKGAGKGEEHMDGDIGVLHVTKSKKKKRKTDEDKTVEKSLKSKEKLKGKGKAKQIILSDEEYDSSGGIDSYVVEENQEDAPVPVNKAKGKGKEKESSSKGSKSSSTSRVDDEEDQDEDVEKNEAQPKKSTPEETPVFAKVSSLVHLFDKYYNIPFLQENMTPAVSRPTYATPNPVYATPAPRPSTTTAAGSLNRRSSTPIYANYTIAPRKSGRPMSELIRHVNSLPGSPFPSPFPTATTSTSSATKIKPLLFRTPTSTAYNPMLKSQRSLLSKIAPLHPNRRTPPPPPPPPPPRKKSKKELEMEEKWEEEMIEDVGGVDAWAAMGDDERREMRKMKWAKELNGWDD